MLSLQGVISGAEGVALVHALHFWCTGYISEWKMFFLQFVQEKWSDSKDNRTEIRKFMLCDILEARTGSYKQLNCVQQTAIEKAIGQSRVSFIWEKFSTISKMTKGRSSFQ